MDCSFLVSCHCFTKTIKNRAQGRKTWIQTRKHGSPLHLASFCVALKSLLSLHLNIYISSSEKKEEIFMSLSLPHVTLKDKKVHEEGDLAPAQPGARASGIPECHKPASLSVTRDSPRRLHRDLTSQETPETGLGNSAVLYRMRLL